ncbi:Fis family transcriptional regulator [Legionella sp. PC1000]|nr:Fis family transcriptional regulator [Legionella sp. PC1000]
MLAIGMCDLINNKEVKMTVIETPEATLSITKQDQGLQDLVYSLVTRFLAENKSKNIDDLYDMILSEVEPPLLQAVMEKRRGNQLQAAKMLGISRGTIRKKLQRYFGTKYFRLTDE